MSLLDATKRSITGEKITYKEISLIPYRIMPCDFGHPVNEQIKRGISDYFEHSNEWTVLPKTNETQEELLSAKLENIDPSISLYLHFYTDGIGIFTLVDQPEKHSDYMSYNPQVTLAARKEAHKALLTHSHYLSLKLGHHINNIRLLFDMRKARITSQSEWENNGLSYVMSFYFINADMRLIEEPEFQDKVTFLLFPYSDYDGVHSAEDSVELIVEPNIVREKFRENFLSVTKKNYEILPHIHTCASWANFLVIGRVTEGMKKEYWELEKDLQRVWFYAYITDKFIENSLKDLSTTTPELELEELDDILTNMTFKIAQYEGIIRSTLPERTFRLYEALKTTSRLDILIKSVERKAGLLKERYNWLLAERRTRADKKIQFMLFLIALISVAAYYKTFKELGLYAVGLGAFTLVLALYFFKPFLRKK